MKREYGKEKRKKACRIYDPRPQHLSTPVPFEIEGLRRNLDRAHEASEAINPKGVAQYGSSCWMKLLAPTSSSGGSSSSSSVNDLDSSSSAGDVDANSQEVHSVPFGLDSEDDDGGDGTQLDAKFFTPGQFYRHHVIVSANRAVAICRRTRGQAQCPLWFKERRKRVKATLLKKVACRRSQDFASVVRPKLSPTFQGNAATRYVPI